jgi:hypothetical protein
MLKRFFDDSETIFWARLQMLVGAVFAVLSQTDLEPLLASVGLDRWTPVVVFVMGVVTEIARRLRADDL